MSVVITNDMDDTVESTVVIVMKKIENFFLVACGVCAIVLSACTIYKMNYDDSNVVLLQEKLDAANALIKRVMEDYDAFDDVTAESDEWCNYYEIMNK